MQDESESRSHTEIRDGKTSILNSRAALGYAAQLLVIFSKSFSSIKNDNENTVKDCLSADVLCFDMLLLPRAKPAEYCDHFG